MCIRDSLHSTLDHGCNGIPYCGSFRLRLYVVHSKDTSQNQSFIDIFSDLHWSDHSSTHRSLVSVHLSHLFHYRFMEFLSLGRCCVPQKVIYYDVLGLLHHFCGLYHLWNNCGAQIHKWWSHSYRTFSICDEPPLFDLFSHCLPLARFESLFCLPHS